jgi:DNA (cytosine-5)-methyltransferase 1
MVFDPISDNLRARLARLRAGEPLQVIDLFSGCGGMSLGLKRAYYNVLGGVEINEQAATTYAKNLFREVSEQEFAIHATPHDITEFSPEHFMREILHKDSPENLVDVIAGGPPCQAFSRIGRAKLRAVRQNPEAFQVDERSSLYLHYLDYVEFFRPLAVIMENVTDIMNYGGKNVAEEIAASLEEFGYRCGYTILNTVHYGIPQLRQRFYLVAFLEALQIEPGFPAPTHFLERMPSGYESAHSVATSTLQPDLFIERYIEPPQPSDTLTRAVVTRDALGDLPPLRDHLRMQMRRGARKFDTLARYITDEPSDYAREMREWPGFESPEGVIDHVIRYLPRDYPIFRMMKPDDQYPQAHQIALDLFQRKIRKYQQKRQEEITEDSELYQRTLKETVPPYDPGKFPNKWWKLNPDRPSRTLTAHMGKDTYSHIHYDSYQGRVISVREAARLQSFPDGFQFVGAMNAAFTQIGNAVAPKQAYVLGQHIKHLLCKAAEQVCGLYDLSWNGTSMLTNEVQKVGD